VRAVQVDAIVFLVDAADSERFPEAKRELDALLSEDYLAKARTRDVWLQRQEYCASAFAFASAA
jgi:ADP-ribosylation factor family